MRSIFRSWGAAFGGLPREAWLLALLELVNRSGTMVLFFLTLYLTQRLGFSLETAGWVASTFGLGSMIGTYYGGRLCDRLGAYRVLKLSLAISGLLYIALQWPHTPLGFAMLLFAVAVTSQALHPANATATAQVCALDQRTRGFALNRLASNLGFALGPVVGGYLALVDYRWLFWVDGLTSLAAAGTAVVLLPAARPRSAHGEGDTASPLAGVAGGGLARLLVVAGGLSLVLHQIINAFPVYLRAEYLFTETGLGRLIVINTLLIVFFEMPLMHWLRTVPPARVLAVGSVLLGLGMGLMPFGRGAIYAAVTVVVWSFGEILALPTLMAMVSARAGHARQGAALGLMSLAFSIGGAAAPMAGLWLYARAGGDAVWYGCAALGLLLAGIVLPLAAAPAAEQAIDGLGTAQPEGEASPS